MRFLISPQFWSTLSSIATTLGFIIVIYSAFVALKQLKEVTRNRHLEAMLQVYEMIGSEAARKQRKFIYTKLKSAPEQVTDEERENLEQVGVIFDRIGKLVSSGLVPKDELFDSHCEVIIKSWEKLQPYIMHYRQLVGWRHLSHFEKLAALARDYYAKHYPEQTIVIVDLEALLANTIQAKLPAEHAVGVSFQKPNIAGDVKEKVPTPRI